jgi:predicted lipoprotein with Yx(FWY)xxD motif
MTAREGAWFSRSRWITAVLAAVLVCAAAAVAVASSGRTAITTQHGKRGKMLAVSSSGRTLYLFERDKGGKSSCQSNGCPTVWPPLLTHGKPVAIKGSGVNQNLLGTTRRSNGKLQVTYNGHPLYEYISDSKPGDMRGENQNSFGARWYVVSTSGKALKPKSAAWNPGSY